MYDPIGPYYTIGNFINNYTLNIFCDASMKGELGCYGAIATMNGIELEAEYRIGANETNNSAEIKAIRLGISIALKYQRLGIPVINIFSDSQINIFAIRDRIYKWRINFSNDKLMGSTGNEIANQGIMIEIMRTIVDNNLRVTFYHQKGHMDPRNPECLKHAKKVFKESNGVTGEIQYGFIEYITIMNNVVDNRTRNKLKKMKPNTKTIIDPICFTTNQFEIYKNKYYELNKYKIKE